MEEILPYRLFLFIALLIYYGTYAIPYVEKHKAPEGTPQWIFWLDVVFVKAVLVILIASVPAYTVWIWETDILQIWEEFAIPCLHIGLSICVWGRIIIHYYYKFYQKFKK